MRPFFIRTGIKMTIKKRYGKGPHFVKFEYVDKAYAPMSDLVKAEPDSAIIIKARDRQGIAAILRKYHAAKSAVMTGAEENIPNYSYRYLAARSASILVATLTKDNAPHIYRKNFYWKLAGFLNRTRKYIQYYKEGVTRHEYCTNP